VSFDITWTGSGPRHHFKTIGETLPDGSITTSFDGKFRQAIATGTFSGSNADGFSFTTVGTASSAQDFFGTRGFAEIGIEHNGSYLR